MTEYRVVDLRTEVIDPETQNITGVSTAEAAAERALGLKLFRSRRPSELRARVYFQLPNGPLTMVRLYTKAPNRPQTASERRASVLRD